ncbi:hypothetical protein [Ectopseudomonas oleovorans]|uniref:Uncharacterized protein (TIGR02646 family) n=1 Tax=Ectopseudomonas oleovorans TaxID=301 RepID=A0A3D9E7H9_ECTOL|nr:hypothetical protein [Pseudomonas oleovorans]REC99026.1 uncharacterized protein (TIGR02646 family) [Pseudomonas oleovorans]
MRYVNRSATTVPISLTLTSGRVKDEMDAARIFYRSYDPASIGSKAFTFKEYKDFDVQHGLRELFKNKCAYCEGELLDDVEVEHFRPKGGVTEDPAHHGYWWLAHTWSNLLPSCGHCNKRRRQHIATESMTEDELLALQAKKPKISYGKMNQFPIAGTRATYSAPDLAPEQPYLINPCEEDPELFFEWSTRGHYSIVVANAADPNSSARALRNISVFGLNRLRLVQSRTIRLNELRYQRIQILEALMNDATGPESVLNLQDALRKVEALKQYCSAEKPYSAMAKAFVESFRAELLGMVAAREIHS